MQINTVYIEMEEYRRLVEENAILNERMGRLYAYMGEEEVKAAQWSKEDGKSYDPAVSFNKVQKIVNYKCDIATQKKINKLLDGMEVKA